MGSPEISLLRQPEAAGVLPRPIRLAFVITGLSTGGAEMMLWKLLSRLDRSLFEPWVIVLSRETGLLDRFHALGVRCETMDLRPANAIMGLQRLRRMLRRDDPDIVQAWMYHANVAASLAALGLRRSVPVLWNIRATLMDSRHEKLLTALIIRLGGKLSFLPTRIINNSVTSASEHEHLGYRRDKRTIVGNGFDVELFRRSDAARRALRASLGLDPRTLLVGHVARFHPMKDHRNFLHAAALVRARHPDAHFVLAGEGVDHANVELTRMISEFGLEPGIHLLGRRSDMHQVTSGLDLLVSSSSSGEGFPNVVGEAMSCEVPCAVTDVGDCADIVGDAGLVVPPRNPQALAAAVDRLLREDAASREKLGKAARARIVENFSLDAIVRKYEKLYLQVHTEHRRQRSH